MKDELMPNNWRKSGLKFASDRERGGVMKRFSPTNRPFGETIVAASVSLFNDLFGAYRPERHYMRGPGPKWRKKHATRTIALRPNVDGDFAEAAVYAAVPRRR
ncbi:MAG: hypothetical protein WAL40_00535 [Rhodoplanes sp.]